MKPLAAGKQGEVGAHVFCSQAWSGHPYDAVDKRRCGIHASLMSRSGLRVGISHWTRQLVKTRSEPNPISSVSRSSGFCKEQQAQNQRPKGARYKQAIGTTLPAQNRRDSRAPEPGVKRVRSEPARILWNQNQRFPLTLRRFTAGIGAGPRCSSDYSAIQGIRPGPMDKAENSGPEPTTEKKREPSPIAPDSAIPEPAQKRKSDETEEPGRRRGKRRRGAGGKKLPPGERYVPPPQKRNPGVSFSQEHFQETSYYFEGGLRKVRPYYFDFQTYCKGRWVGKTLLEVFSSEFRAEPIEYYRQAAAAGRIRLNEEPVRDLGIVLKNNDFLRNTVHRHEPPVSARPLEVLSQEAGLVVVDKPASLPVHPCGRFRHNSVLFLLGKERGLGGLHTVHRLDRLTSGVLLLARTLEASQRLDQLVRDRELEKEYVCRVRGQFPEGEVVCEEPILVVSYKVGVCRVDPRGKPCRTVFRRLHWDSRNGSSVVSCLPLTGRTHQIRVHLQFLGHPITNDPIYSSPVWGPEGGRGGRVDLSNEELLRALVEEHRANESLHLLDIAEGELDKGGEPQGTTPQGLGLSEGSAVTCQAGENVLNEVAGAGHQTQSNHSIIKGTGKDSGCCDESEGSLCAQGVPLADDTDLKETAAENPVPRGGAAGESAQRSGGEIQAGTEADAPASPPVKDPLCSECRIARQDPTEKELVMYLHALRYKGPDFEYSTRLPEWAREDWLED
ncbi:RNA pseudouridylate synthase domain-containing protein 2-like [Polyodon spathula]|uniref:RNA pseudouridylate synthase domain-containing protein 2-like n=1 Tax=Polyodon spathula TaxID=7913 RepID=UPI001B7F28F8|nr:RNA pseudouridylate synthase domain-containing protein 2-like [Polyodon spathula]